MFTGGSSSGGNLERQNPARGAAHPYLDSVPASTGPPLFPSYNSRDRVEDDNRAGDNAAADGDAAGNSFNEEDRMLLRLLYHQQQAIQVQLNTMTEWMQQVNYRITNVERALRASRSTMPTTAAPPSSGAPRSYPAQPQSRSASAMEGYAPMSSPHLASQPRPMAQATAEVTHAPPSAPGSTYSGQSPQLSSALAVSSVLEGSRACTPPSAQTRHQMGGAVGSSAVPSTTRSYESALAAPWDPHNASQQSLGGGGAVHSRTSSHTSALGRRANPLLNSSASKGKVQAPGAASRSSLMDSRQQLSRLDTSGLSGAGQTSSMGVSGVVPDAVSASGQPRQPPMVSPPTSSAVPYADAVVPPYRRIPTEPTTLPRQPLSRLAAASRHAPPSGALADLAEERAGREGTLPPPPRSAATSSLQDNDESHRDGNRHALQQPPSTTEQSSKESARATASASPAAASTSTHADPAGSGGGESSLRPRKGGVHRVAADDDSLSDGYGSYESRMYMKNLGLL